MGFLSFLVLILVVCALAYGGCWVLGKMVPGHPVIIDYIIWGVALFIIGMALLNATGLTSYDPQIPRLK